MSRRHSSSIGFLVTLSAIIFMVDMGAEAFGASKTAPFSLVPSQLLVQKPSRYRLAVAIQSSGTNLTGNETMVPLVSEMEDESRPKGRGGKKKRSKKKKRNFMTPDQQSPIDDALPAATSPTKNTTDNASLVAALHQAATRKSTILSYPKSGNHPDVYWRSVPMEHLRQHPKFQPLPEPHEITHLQCLEDVRLFRQESWQWDTLHSGRCTTSQAVAALGFLEPLTGEMLGVPSYWQRGGMGAFYKLRQKAVRTLDDMNSVLCSHGNAAVDEATNMRHDQRQLPLWRSRGNDEEAHFMYHYLYQTPSSEVKRRKARLHSINAPVKNIRMAWGNAQEATALLTALNYFSEKDPGFVMKETGMCGAGLDLNQTLSKLLIGATPDAILHHTDGSIEALEVKNHCPFVVPWVSKGKRRSDHRFIVGDFPFDDSVKVFSHYIPQLMMEMLCLGPECRSVVLVRQTATNGALLLRIHRDDAWIDDMVHYLQRFQTEFVVDDNPPPQNFFWVDRGADKEETARYRRFVNKTLEIRNKVEIITHVPHEKIQRVSSAAPWFLD